MRQTNSLLAFDPGGEEESPGGFREEKKEFQGRRKILTLQHFAFTAVFRTCRAPET